MYGLRLAGASCVPHEQLFRMAKQESKRIIFRILALRIVEKQLFLYDDNYLYRKGKKFLNYLKKNKLIENKLLYDLFENLSTTKIGELLLLYDDITINFPKM